ncbi:CU044_5270 family protein (plasmid) [Streptomyces sp. NBC_01591]|uniref:CU044_5270 family protein n=1 Tax=Streptomyces sp. NBC_01591 TaxID=2975888 RepID=UPI002DD957BC|nr:CU044_5270 family protein [Streptomyces sp. NBC_01591]WSD74129.1 CU044_5270 family protein [Streptomyces sp. NBC_01591]
MKNDILHRLTAARPAHLDPGRPTPSPVREEELATVMTRPRATRRARATPQPRRVGRPLLSGLALATAAAVAVLAIIETAPQEPGPAPSATSGSGSQVLLAAASHVEQQPAGSGTYWYVEKHLGSLHKVPGKNYTVAVRTEQRYWTAAARNKQWSQLLDLGARPATKADEAAWKADGSPTSWNLRGETVTYAGKGEIQHDAPGGIADIGTMGDLPLRLLATLPTDEQALRKRLFALVDKDYNAPEEILDRTVVDTAVRIATTLPSTPALRAAAYRLLAAEPGVRSLGDVKDHTGRTGYAVALPSPHGPAELRLIFDKSTGMPLGTETVATRSGDGVSKGELQGYTTITSMKWTEDAPPFDTDTEDPGPISAPGEEPDAEPAR